MALLETKNLGISWQQRQKHRRHDGTADIADTAQHHEYQDHNRHIVAKILGQRIQRRQIMRQVDDRNL